VIGYFDDLLSHVRLFKIRLKISDLMFPAFVLLGVFGKGFETVFTYLWLVIDRIELLQAKELKIY
jgi:hypothetical protein